MEYRDSVTMPKLTYLEFISIFKSFDNYVTYDYINQFKSNAFFSDIHPEVLRQKNDF